MSEVKKISHLLPGLCLTSGEPSPAPVAARLGGQLYVEKREGFNLLGRSE